MLAAKAPALRQAPEKAVERGLADLIPDGTLICPDRRADKTSKKGRQIDKRDSGTAQQPAGNGPALAAPGGVPPRVPGVRPGGTRDLIAAPELVPPQARPHPQ